MSTLSSYRIEYVPEYFIFRSVFVRFLLRRVVFKSVGIKMFSAEDETLQKDENVEISK